jgi:hypothetical protein
MLVLLYHEEQEWEEAYFIESINQVYIQQKRTELTEWLTELPNLELTEYVRENNAGRLEITAVHWFA